MLAGHALAFVLLLRIYGAEKFHLGFVWKSIRGDIDAFSLPAGSILRIECCRDFTGFSGFDFFFRPFRHRAAAGGAAVGDNQRDFSGVFKPVFVLHHGAFAHLAKIEFRFFECNPGHLVGIGGLIGGAGIADQVRIGSGGADFLYALAIALAGDIQRGGECQPQRKENWVFHSR